MARLNESDVEIATVDYFRELGYEYVHGAHIAPDGEAPEPACVSHADRCDVYGQFVLVGRLRDALFRINPYVPTEAGEAVRKVECPCC